MIFWKNLLKILNNQYVWPFSVDSVSLFFLLIISPFPQYNFFMNNFSWIWKPCLPSCFALDFFNNSFLLNYFSISDATIAFLNSYFVILGQCLDMTGLPGCIPTWFHVLVEEVVHDADEVIRSSIYLWFCIGGPPVVDVVASLDLDIFVTIWK